MELFDVSVPLRGPMPSWPGDPGFRSELASAIADGAAANVTRLDLGAHTGTHVDAPRHFLDGAGGAETIPLDALVGGCLVVDATSAEQNLDVDSLADVPEGTERVLFKTRNSELWQSDAFAERHLQLSEAIADEVVRRGLRLVGIDYLSIGSPEVHRTLLRAGVVPLEGLDLSGIEPGPYRLLCLPLRLVGADGAPARVVLARD